jgi:peptidyl-prolyl cis-trans isomerase SurA
MKKIFLFVFYYFILSLSYGQTLFTYGNHSVSKGEFLRAYNKNKSIGPNTDQAKRNYLQLYTIFKLKVQAARDMHMDTLPFLHSDLQNFRTQIENNYLKDPDEVNKLVDEAFRRSQKDIHVQHFYVFINSKMKPEDTLKLYKAINETYEELKKGSTDYDGVLSEISEKIAPVRGNDLGWITAFTIPYEFENIVYGLSPGQVSKPFRSKTGWHIFKNEQERPAEGKIKIAQILFAFPNGNILLRDQAKRLADSVYKALQSGADFQTLAKKYSDDRTTYMNGGIMPVFGVAKYDGTFEKEAFALKNDGDISAPFQTEFGYHIIKRIARYPVPSNENDETFMASLKDDVLHDSRIELAKDIFMKEVMVKTGFKYNNAINHKDLWKLTDTFYVANKIIPLGNIDEKSVLFSFNNEKVFVGDWLKYVKSVRRSYSSEVPVSYPDLLKNYVSLAALENYKKRLEKFNPDFKYQLQEFEEGNLLFEVMQKKVWSKAASDSVGLKKFYEDHKTKYKWSTSADAILFSCAKSSVADEAREEITKNKNWRKLFAGNDEIQVDSARYELSQIPVNSKIEFTPGMITNPVVNKGDGTAVFALILKMYPGNEPRSFDDARGLVINDYQNYLEKKWVEELKKKYPVHINEKVFKSIL